MIIDIPIEYLLIDLRNPRYEPRANQREALETIAQDPRTKLFNLAEDIVTRGLNPSELPIVTGPGSDGLYIVLEGNRRIAALKLLASPSLAASLTLPRGHVKKYQTLSQQNTNTIPKAIACSVLTEAEARHWIDLKHTGANDGVGIVVWDGVQRQRFRGLSPALQVIEFARDGGHLDESTKEKLSKIPITTVKRLIETADVRPVLGIEIEGNKQTGKIVFIEPKETVVARLSKLVSDIANRTVNVSNFRDVPARVAYAQEVATHPLPAEISEPTEESSSTVSKIPSVEPPSTSSTTSSEESPSTSSTTPLTPVVLPKTGGRRISPYRKTLIPTSFKIPIKENRINQIYHELQKLDVEQFVNSCAVMLRVFLELSLDNFAERNNISLVVERSNTDQERLRQAGRQPSRTEMNLHKKAETVAGYLEQNRVWTSEQLRPIRSMIAGTKLFTSIDTLHGFVHSPDYNPIPTDLKATWDNIQSFIEVILMGA